MCKKRVLQKVSASSIILLKVRDDEDIMGGGSAI